MTLSQILKQIRSQLSPVCGSCALPEAERLLTVLLDCSRMDLYLNAKKEISRAMSDNIANTLERRLTGEPLAYILNRAYFYDREFFITPSVLIPRPDTEILVETVLRFERAPDCFFLDLCTGSGCCAAICMEHNPQWRCCAADRSIDALLIAKKNCPENVVLICADMGSCLKDTACLDFIVSNPPYIAQSVIPTLDSSVRDYEPAIALDGGPDGLDFYRNIASEAPRLLKSSGRIYCEIGYDQGESVPAIFENLNWSEIAVFKDLAGNFRVVRAVRPYKF